MEDINFFDKAISFYTDEPINIPKAIEYFEKAADIEADSLAMEFLINIYKDDLMSKDLEKYWTDRFFETIDEYEKAEFCFKNKNYTEAIEWFEKSAENGNTNSMYKLGLLYHDGGQIDENLEKALYYLELAAENGNSNSMYKLGLIYHDGVVVDKNIKKAFHYFDWAAQQGHKAALFACALFHDTALLDDNPNFEKAFLYAEKASEMDDEQALHMIGSYYENGLFVSKDIEKAYEYYLRSSDLHFPNALPFRDDDEIFDDNISHELSMVRAWLSTEKHQLAIDWYTKAVNNNDIDAIMDLGLMYFYGYEVEKDFDKSFSYFNKAAELENAKALFYVGLHYDQGYVGEDSDIEKALPFMLKSSELGYAEAKYFMGNYYEMGFDIVGGENAEKSFENYSQAALLGYKKAFGLVGDAYKYGYGVGENLEKAFFWYLQGAKNNDYNSLHNLISCYADGIGVEKNEEELEYWREIVKDVENPGYLN